MGHRTNDRSFFESAPNGFSVADVTVRLAESRERVQRDATVNRHHYLVQDSPTLAEHPLQAGAVCGLRG